MPNELTPDTVERIEREAKDKYPVSGSHVLWTEQRSAYISGATTYALKSVELVEALEKIGSMTKFSSFSKDGAINEIAKQALDKYKK